MLVLNLPQILIILGGNPFIFDLHDIITLIGIMCFVALITMTFVIVRPTFRNAIRIYLITGGGILCLIKWGIIAGVPLIIIGLIFPFYPTKIGGLTLDKPREEKMSRRTPRPIEHEGPPDYLTSVKNCRKCGERLTYIEIYDGWYCGKCDLVFKARAKK
jgi:ribosomal protein S27AE